MRKVLGVLVAMLLASACGEDKTFGLSDLEGSYDLAALMELEDPAAKCVLKVSGTKGTAECTSRVLDWDTGEVFDPNVTRLDKVVFQVTEDKVTATYTQRITVSKDWSGMQWCTEDTVTGDLVAEETHQITMDKSSGRDVGGSFSMLAGTWKGSWTETGKLTVPQGITWDCGNLLSVTKYSVEADVFGDNGKVTWTGLTSVEDGVVNEYFAEDWEGYEAELSVIDTQTGVVFDSDVLPRL